MFNVLCNYYFEWLMKTKKSYHGLIWVILIVVVALVCYGFYCGNLNYVVVAFMVLCLFVVPLDFYYEHLKEKADPLNYKNRCEALAYAVSVRTGSKDDFVQCYSSEMYNVLLDRGYIHELSQTQEPDASPRWEITRLGLNVHSKK